MISKIESKDLKYLFNFARKIEFKDLQTFENEIEFFHKFHLANFDQLTPVDQPQNLQARSR